MDIRKVKKLIELIEESGIAEIEIKEGEESVRISRMGSGVVAAQPMLAAAPLAHVAAATPIADAPATPEIAGHAVTSPMVGTFYRAPAPGAKNFAVVCSDLQIRRPCKDGLLYGSEESAYIRSLPRI
jgi:acetyl-CoA carboxylase biotin carboxyl carrier protein